MIEINLTRRWSMRKTRADYVREKLTHMSKKEVVDHIQDKYMLSRDCARGTVNQAIKFKSKSGYNPSGTPNFETKINNRDDVPVYTEEDLLAKYDYNYVIDKALKDLKPGIFYLESVFRAEVLGISALDFKKAVDNKDYSKYFGEARGKVYWGEPESINRMKNRGVLNEKEKRL